MNPQKKSIPKSNQTNSKMPYPSLPLSTGQSKKKKKNPKNLELQTRRSTMILSPRATTTHHNLPWSTSIQNPTNATGLERPTNSSNPRQTWETHNPRPTPDLREPWLTPNLMHPRTMKKPWSTEKTRSLALAMMARERWDERAQTVWEESFSGRQTWESGESGRQLRE